MEKITRIEKAAIRKMASSGGRKAAENMTAEERKLRAQKAVEAREVNRIRVQLIPGQISRDITYLIYRMPGDKYDITYEDGRVHASGQMKYLRVFLIQSGKASQREIERIGQELDRDGKSRITVTRHKVFTLG
jgi:hypothetical protein